MQPCLFSLNALRTPVSIAVGFKSGLKMGMLFTDCNQVYDMCIFVAEDGVTIEVRHAIRLRTFHYGICLSKKGHLIRLASAR